jgi:hypothetical protein
VALLFAALQFKHSSAFSGKKRNPQAGVVNLKSLGEILPKTADACGDPTD